jgi:hypothetical protein
MIGMTARLFSPISVLPLDVKSNQEQRSTDCVREPNSYLRV